MDIPAATAIDSLARLQLSPVLLDDRIEVVVPSCAWTRTSRPISSRRSARVIGYNQIPVREEISIRLTPPEPHHQTIDTIHRRWWVADTTRQSPSRSSATCWRMISSPGDPSLPRADAMVRKADARLRPSMLPGLLEAVRRNEAAGTGGAAAL